MSSANQDSSPTSPSSSPGSISDLTSTQRGQWREVTADQLARKPLPAPVTTPPAEPLPSAEAVEDSQPAAESHPESHPESKPEPQSATESPPQSQPTSDAAQPSAKAPVSDDPASSPSPNEAADIDIEKPSTQQVSAAKRLAVEKQPPKLRLERRQELEHRLKASPTDLDAYMELGRIYRADNRPLDAKRIFQQAIQIFPDEQELLWEYEEAVLARSLQQLREVSDLAKRLETVETEHELKRSQNDWACRRMDICRARLSRDASLVHLRVALAEAMYDGELYEAAVDELEPILNNDELSPAAYLIRGRCLLAMGKDIEAMKSLRAVALRRAVVAPLKSRIVALRLLCDTAERLGVTLTLEKYRQHLQQAEQELAAQTPSGA